MSKLWTVALSLLCLGLAAFSGPEKNLAKFTLSSAAGTALYKTDAVAVFYEPANGKTVFYFKLDIVEAEAGADLAAFRSMMQPNAYREVRFDGTLADDASKLGMGKSMTTTANGTLRYLGVQRPQNIPVRVTRLSADQFALSYTALIDWTSNKTSLAAGQKLKLQGPINLKVTHNL